MDISKLIADVRHILDEQELVQDPALEYSGVDSLDIGARVRSLFVGSFNLFVSIAPLWMVREKLLPVNGLEYDSGQGTGWLPLPTDYVRLGRFKMVRWKREVHTAISDDSDEYRLQLCGATRGGVKNPVVAVCDGRTRLEYYSLPRGVEAHEVEEATYVAGVTSAEDSDAVLTERGYNAFVWWIARDVALTFKTEVGGISEKIKELGVIGG